MPGFFRTTLPKLLIAVFLATGLSGCYVPVSFYTEVEIDRTGYYEMKYDGYLAWAPLYDALRKGTLSPLEEQEKVAQITTDLKRDTATQEVRYMRRGRFKVDWRMSGDLFQAKMVTFVRQSDKIMTLKFIKDTGEMIFEGTSTSRSRAKQLLEAGLNVAGDLRVKTDARVVSHNATSVTKNGGRGQVYAWKIKSVFDPPPRLVIATR
jgi:hypothetical protein